MIRGFDWGRRKKETIKPEEEKQSPSEQLMARLQDVLLQYSYKSSKDTWDSDDFELIYPQIEYTLQNQFPIALSNIDAGYPSRYLDDLTRITVNQIERNLSNTPTIILVCVAAYLNKQYDALENATPAQNPRQRFMVDTLNACTWIRTADQRNIPALKGWAQQKLPASAKQYVIDKIIDKSSSEWTRKILLSTLDNTSIANVDKEFSQELLFERSIQKMTEIINNRRLEPGHLKQLTGLIEKTASWQNRYGETIWHCLAPVIGFRTTGYESINQALNLLKIHASDKASIPNNTGETGIEAVIKASHDGNRHRELVMQLYPLMKPVGVNGEPLKGEHPFVALANKLTLEGEDHLARECRMLAVDSSIFSYQEPPLWPAIVKEVHNDKPNHEFWNYLVDFINHASASSSLVDDKHDALLSLALNHPNSEIRSEYTRTLLQHSPEARRIFLTKMQSEYHVEKIKPLNLSPLILNDLTQYLERKGVTNVEWLKAGFDTTTPLLNI